MEEKQQNRRRKRNRRNRPHSRYSGADPRPNSEDPSASSSSPAAGGKEMIRHGLQFAAASLIVFLLFRFLLTLVMPFCIAALLAVLLYPAVRLLHRRLHLPVLAGGALVLTTFLSALLIGAFYLGRALINQLVAFFQNFAVYQTFLTERVGGICSGCDRIFRLEHGTVMGVVESAMTVFLERIQTDILPALTAKTLQFAAGTAAILGVVLIVLVSTLMMIKDMEYYRGMLRRLKQTPVFGTVLTNLHGGGAAYLRTQLFILALVALILSLGLFLLRNPYALVIGIAIAVFDAFPVLGSGLILVPWAAVHLFAGRYYQAVVLAILYLICQVIREVLEPRLLSGKLGIRPVSAMIAIYVGLRLFGIAGVILGPLGLIFVLAIAPALGINGSGHQ